MADPDPNEDAVEPVAIPGEKGEGKPLVAVGGDATPPGPFDEAGDPPLASCCPEALEDNLELRSGTCPDPEPDPEPFMLVLAFPLPKKACSLGVIGDPRPVLELFLEPT